MPPRSCAPLGNDPDTVRATGGPGLNPCSKVIVEQESITQEGTRLRRTSPPASDISDPAWIRLMMSSR